MALPRLSVLTTLSRDQVRPELILFSRISDYTLTPGNITVTFLAECGTMFKECACLLKYRCRSFQNAVLSVVYSRARLLVKLNEDLIVDTATQITNRFYNPGTVTLAALRETLVLFSEDALPGSLRIFIESWPTWRLNSNGWHLNHFDYVAFYSDLCASGVAGMDDYVSSHGSHCPWLWGGRSAPGHVRRKNTWRAFRF